MCTAAPHRTAHSMSTAASLNHAALAKDLGGLVPSPGGQSRLVVNGKTLAYLKAHTLAVPAALVTKAPKRLGSFKVEANGRWSNVAVDSDAERGAYWSTWGRTVSDTVRCQALRCAESLTSWPQMREARRGGPR